MNDNEIKSRNLVFTGRHLPYNPKLVERAKELRKHMTSEENRLWFEYLKTHTYRFRRQHPIDNYIVVFYCAELKLVVELDGEQHYTKGGISYDREREAVLSSYDLIIQRVTNNEINTQFKTVCATITDICENLSKE